MTTMTRVPFIDLRLLREGGSGRERFAKALGQAFEGIGFAVLKHHGIQEAMLIDAYRITKDLFAQPGDVLRRYETPENGRQTGFTSFKVEHAKDQIEGDLKEFWHIRRDLPKNHPRRADPAFVPNIWPHEVPKFRTVMIELFRQLDELAFLLADPLNLYLGYAPGTIEGMFQDGETLLRVLHYPAVTGEMHGIRSAAHEDIDFLTLLMAGTASGLEVMTRDGEWVAVNETPGSIVLNPGDMLHRLTKGRFLSATHRVVNPDPTDTSERYSMPFFVHPRSDVVLDADTGFTAGEFLQQRLAEIGLYGGTKPT